VEVNDKDLIDAIALLLVHPIGQRGPGTVNLDELEPILRADWGWYTTIRDNLAKVGARVPGGTSNPTPEHASPTGSANSTPRSRPSQRREVDTAFEDRPQDALV